MEEVLTALQSPWQNLYVERLIGWIRLNLFVIFNARHLKRTLASYFVYYQDPGPIWGWTSNVQFHDRWRVSEGSSRFPNSVGCIIVMNALLHDQVPAYALLAKDRVEGKARTRATSQIQNPYIAGFRSWIANGDEDSLAIARQNRIGDFGQLADRA
jgi:hypothetical protein